MCTFMQQFTITELLAQTYGKAKGIYAKFMNTVISTETKG